MKLLRSYPLNWIPPFLLGNALMLLAVLAVIRPGNSGGGPGAPVLNAASRTVLSQSSANPQPWGQLTTLRFPLADAGDTDSVCEKLTGAPKWFFSGVTEKQLLRYFLSLNLRFRDRQVLLNRNNWRVSTDGIEVSPTESVVYALDAFSRTRIYAALARSAANPLQHQVLVLPRVNLDAQLSALGLTGLQIIRVKQLTYFSAGRLCLADLGVARKILGPEKFQNLVEFLFATPAYRLRLVVSAASDIDALAKYWGRGGREELIKPMLKSLARVPGGTDISVSALLPDFARLRLYHYPDVAHDGSTADAQDCIYSAMNFFNRTPDTNFINGDFVQRVLKRDYEPVANAPTFGDVVLFTGESKNVIHMCIYIADEFVFTKNGMSSREPWTLMRVEDVASIYCTDRAPARINLLRLKEAPAVKPSSS